MYALVRLQSRVTTAASRGFALPQPFARKECGEWRKHGATAVSRCPPQRAPPKRRPRGHLRAAPVQQGALLPHHARAAGVGVCCRYVVPAFNTHCESSPLRRRCFTLRALVNTRSAVFARRPPLTARGADDQLQPRSKFKRTARGACRCSATYVYAARPDNARQALREAGDRLAKVLQMAGAGVGPAAAGPCRRPACC